MLHDVFVKTLCKIGDVLLGTLPLQHLQVVFAQVIMTSHLPQMCCQDSLQYHLTIHVALLYIIPGQERTLDKD